MRTIALGRPFAVFSDVHGNLPGLEAILADIERPGHRRALCLGDLVGYGPYPNEVSALIRDRGIPTLMGNYDQGIGFSTGDCGCVYKTDEQRAEGAVSLAWTDEVTTEETRAYLRTLEDRFVLDTPAGELLAVHGSPRRINEYLFEDRPESAMARMARESLSAPSSSVTRTCPTRARSPRRRARRCSSTSAAAAGPRTATGACATRSSTRPRSPPASRPSSSCACPTTTSA